MAQLTALTPHQCIRCDLIEIYKVVHGLSAILLCTSFESDTSGRTHKNIPWRVMLLWNSLDSGWSVCDSIVDVIPKTIFWNSEIIWVGLWTSVFRDPRGWYLEPGEMGHNQVCNS